MNRIRSQSLIALLVTFTLLFAGMRLPDLTRPHRPKPRPRAVVENEQKSAPKSQKAQNADLVAIPLAPCKTLVRRSRETTWVMAYAPLPSPRPVCNSGRSPPA